MSVRSNNFHVTGWKAFALAPVAIPIILVLKLFGIGQTVERSAEDVAGYLRDFIQGTGGDWDWDDFISVTIKSPELESIRAQAANVELPVDSAGLLELKKLLFEAEALAGRPASSF